MSNFREDLEKGIRDSVKIDQNKPKSTMESIVDLVESEISDFCPKCDEEVYSWERFCMNCGLSNSIFDQSQESPDALQVADCQNNHKDINHENDFCSYCGSKVSDST